MGKKSLHEVII